MITKMLTTIKLDRRLVLNQKLKQAITLLQYNTQNLQQLIKQYIETNPFIEVEEAHTDEQDEEEDYLEPHYSARLNQGASRFSDEFAFENYAKRKTLREVLLEQTLLCHFDKTQQMMAEMIIDAINDNGFLMMSDNDIHEHIAKQLPVDLEDVHNVLNLIRTFEPAGVGSRNIRDCLKIQLNAFTAKDDIWALACAIVDLLSDDSSIKNMSHLIKNIKAPQEQLNEALHLIKSLNFYPGATFSADDNYYIEPELLVKKVASTWKVFLADSLSTNIKINKQYQDILKNQKKLHCTSLRRELEEAKWLINGIKKRNDTLLNVGSHIVSLQQPFLEHGHEHMKPMTISHVSNALGIHESTVSRITSEKYISTPQGIFELKFFFPSHVTTQSGHDCSAVTVKSFIKSIIEDESDHIYSDNEIADLLQQKGINIARRTVTKYREAMHILSSYQRQQQSHLARKKE